MPGRTGLGPAHHEAPVGLVGERGPHLLPGDHPLVPVELGPGGHVGEVAPGVRLRVALAPQLGPVHDPREEPVLLSLRPVLDQGGPEHPSPRMLTRPGAFAFTYSSLKITWWAMDAPGRRTRPATRGRSTPFGQDLLPLETDFEAEGLVPDHRDRRGRRTRPPRGRPARSGPPCGRPRPRVGLEGPWWLRPGGWGRVGGECRRGRGRCPVFGSGRGRPRAVEARRGPSPRRGRRATGATGGGARNLTLRMKRFRPRRGPGTPGPPPAFDRDRQQGTWRAGPGEGVPGTGAGARRAASRYVAEPPTGGPHHGCR